MGEKCYFISEASRLVGVEAHVLRYWEEQLELPIKRNEMGHRYYIEEDIRLMQSIKQIMEKGIQLRAVKMILPGLMEHREDILVELTGAAPEPLSGAEREQSEAGEEPERENHYEKVDRQMGTGSYERSDQVSGDMFSDAAEKATEFGHQEAAASQEEAGEYSYKGYELDEDITGEYKTGKEEGKEDTTEKYTTGKNEASENMAGEYEPEGYETKEYEPEEYEAREEYEEDREGDTRLAGQGAMQEVLEGSRELAADRQEVLESTRELRMLQFQEIMSNLIGQALQRNNQELAAATGDHVTERVIKEMDYLMRVRDSQEEERYKKLDETIRSLQKSRAGKRLRRGKR